MTRERLVFENDTFAVISPFAARVPYETWIVPKSHNCDFTSIRDADCGDLAQALKHILLRLRTLLQDPPLNYLIHTAPFRRPRPGYWATIQHDYHWHLEVIPRITRIAGFEEGSGFYINPVSPEDAAALLRKVQAEPGDDETPKTDDPDHKMAG